MATPINEPPVAVDYTSRDYFSLRQDLINRIKTRLPAWSGDNPADFGLALVEAFAYMGDVLNYYVDRVANESYLPTATQRQSVLNIAKSYGYFPAGYRASSLTLQLVNSGSTSATLPAGSQFTATITNEDTTFELIFSIAEAVTVPAAVSGVSGSATVTAYQYEQIADRPANAALSSSDISGELLGVSNGLPEQTYRLFENQVVEGSVEVWVQNGDIFEKWQEVTHIVDYGPNDPVYSVTTDASNYVYVTFGDGVSGIIPTLNTVLKAKYLVGGGASGNISTNLVTEITYVPELSESELAALSTTVEVTNTTVGVGGASPEDIASIKVNAPKALTALNRAVSLNDYAALALQVSGTGKAKAVADIWSSVTVYVSPQRNQDSIDQFPGYSANPDDGGVLLPEWSLLQSDIEEFLVNKTQLGVTVTVSPPTYVPVSVDIFYTKQAQYTEATIETAIRKSIVDRFSYSSSSFNQIIHPEEIEALLRQIPGILNAKVTGLYRSADSASRGILIGEPDEIFVFLTDDISVDPYSSNASLSALSSNSGTLSPTFSASFYSYSLVVPNGTTSVNLTATTASSQAVLKEGATVRTSGTPFAVATPVGTTPVELLVIAGDGITLAQYEITVTRVS
jgi:hypothetical protein